MIDCTCTGVSEIYFAMYMDHVSVKYTKLHHKHGSAYSRTEPENAKTGCQDLSPSAR